MQRSVCHRRVWFRAVSTRHSTNRFRRCRVIGSGWSHSAVNAASSSGVPRTSPRAPSKRPDYHVAGLGTGLQQYQEQRRRFGGST